MAIRLMVINNNILTVIIITNHLHLTPTTQSHNISTHLATQPPTKTNTTTHLTITNNNKIYISTTTIIIINKKNKIK